MPMTRVLAYLWPAVPFIPSGLEPVLLHQLRCYDRRLSRRHRGGRSYISAASSTATSHLVLVWVSVVGNHGSGSAALPWLESYHTYFLTRSMWTGIIESAMPISGRWPFSGPVFREHWLSLPARTRSFRACISTAAGVQLIDDK